MTKKKDLQGGIASLLSGANTKVTETQEAPQMELEPTTSQEEQELLNSLEDEEFRKELEARLLQKKAIGRGRPRKNDQLGRRPDGYERTTIIVHRDKWAKIKEISLIETLTIKEIMELAIDDIIERYEAKHGEIKIAPIYKKNINEIF